MFRDETQISTAWLHSGCFGLEFVARQVEVYLLAAEFEGVAGCVSNQPWVIDTMLSYRSTPSPETKVSWVMPRCVV
jgi:hypothetical protein